MNLQPKLVDIVVGKEFMRTTTGIEFKTAGATVDVSEFADVTEDGVIKAGTAVGRNEDGLYVPFKADSDLKGAGLTASDIVTDGEDNQIVGIVLAGYANEDKCTNITDEFKDEVKGYLRFDA